MNKHTRFASASRRALNWRASFHRLRASAPVVIGFSTFVFGAALIPRAQAANDAWSTAPADGTFTGINWTVGTTTPGAATGTIAAGDSLYFGASSITTLNENEAAGFSIGGFTFNAGASAYTIAGNAFALTGGITNNSTALQTLNDAFTLAATQTFTTTAGGGDLALGGAISGAGGITKAGLGTLTLSGPLSYTGITAVNAGVLTLTGTGTTGALNLSQTANGTSVLNLASTGTLGLGGNDFLIAGAAATTGVVNQTTGTVNQNTGNQLVLGSGSTSAFAGYNLSGGTLNLGIVRAGGTGASAEGNSLFTQTGGTSTFVNYFIGRNSSGMNAIYLNGATSLLNVTTTLTIGYVGSGTSVLTVAGGTLNSTGAVNMGNTSNGTFTGTAVLNLNGGTVRAPSVIRAAGTAIANFNGGALQATAASTAFITGLASANVYAGGAKIDTNGFALTIGQPLLTTSGTTGVTTIPVANGGSGYLTAPLVSITGGGGTGATAVANLTNGVVTSITITSPGTGYTTAPNVALIGGGAGTAATLGTLATGANAATDGGLTKNGLGTMTLTGANTYNGGTVINGGSLLFNAAAALPATGAITINGGGALVDAGAFTTVTGALTSGRITTGSTGSIALAGNSTENIDFTAYPSLMLGASANSIYTGMITPGSTGYHLGGGTATLTLSGTNALTGNNALTVGATGSTGIVILSGTNNYTGGTTVNGSTLQFATTAALPAGAIAVNSGGTLAVNAGGAGEFTNGTTGAGTIGGVLASATFSPGAVFGVDTTNAGGSLTYAGNITNAGLGFTKLGTGTLNLSGNNTYTGPTTVSVGTLQAGVATVAGTSGAFGVNSAVTLANVAGATLDLNGFNTQVGSLTGGGTTGGNVTLGAGTLTTGADNTSPAAYAGVISGTGGLTKIGTGTLNLGNKSTFTGGTTVNGGTLTLASGGGAGTVQGVVTINPGTTLNLAATDALGYTAGTQITAVNVNGGTVNNTAGGNQGYLTSFNLAGGTVTAGGIYRFNVNATPAPGITSLASGTTSVFAANIDDYPGAPAPGTLGVSVAAGSTASGVDLTLSGVIANSSGSATNVTGLTKTGAGTLALTAANTYNGPTVVNAGTLLVNGSTVAASAVTVNNAGTVLTGTGTVAGTVSVGSGAIISAGNKGAGTPTLGTLTTGALTLNTGSTFNSLLASNSNFGKLSAAGTTALGGAAFSISLTPGAAFTNGSVLTLITSNVSGQFTNTVVTVGGYNFTADYTTNAGFFDVDVSAVPEPATWLAGGLLVGLVGFSRRRSLGAAFKAARHC